MELIYWFTSSVFLKNGRKLNLHIKKYYVLENDNCESESMEFLAEESPVIFCLTSEMNNKFTGLKQNSFSS